MPGLLEQSRWKSKQYHIYALADPRDNLVRYIGITTDTKYRYRQHSRRGYNRSIWRWARELEHVGGDGCPGSGLPNTSRSLFLSLATEGAPE